MNDVGSQERTSNDGWKPGLSRAGDSAGEMPEQGRPGVRRKAVTRSQRTAYGLGWFSVGLGLAEILAPRALGRAIGLGYGPMKGSIFRGYGLREIAAGVGILSRRRPAAWMWARFVGDLLDLASLGTAMGTHRRGRDRARIAGAIGAVARRDGARLPHRPSPGKAPGPSAQARHRPLGRGHEDDDHRTSRGGGLSILARFSEPAAVHGAPRIGGGRG